MDNLLRILLRLLDLTISLIGSFRETKLNRIADLRRTFLKIYTVKNDSVDQIDFNTVMAKKYFDDLMEIIKNI